MFPEQDGKDGGKVAPAALRKREERLARLKDSGIFCILNYIMMTLLFSSFFFVVVFVGFPILFVFHQIVGVCACLRIKRFYATPEFAGEFSPRSLG